MEPGHLTHFRVGYMTFANPLTAPPPRRRRRRIVVRPAPSEENRFPAGDDVMRPTKRQRLPGMPTNAPTAGAFGSLFRKLDDSRVKVRLGEKN
jgi:hypothetical protein